jgi:hypothetical protein
MTVKDDLHQLVDQLDDDAAREALAYLQTLSLPPVLRDAPLDDEPETAEERAAVAEAEADLRAGRVVPHEAIQREFGE